MFFILTLLNAIKNDEKVKEENYEIVRKINDFFEIYANNSSEKRIEEALKKHVELKQFVDAYLLNLTTQQIAALAMQAESAKKSAAKQQQKQNNKKPPYNKKAEIERGL